VDHQTFDALSKAVARRITRRSALGTLGAILGLSRLSTGEAAACRGYGVTCTTHGQCCSGTCNPQNSRGRRTCSCPADVLNDPENCGECGNACPHVPNSSPVCTKGTCDWICDPGYYRSENECLPQKHDAELCGDNNQCLGGLCACTSRQSTTCYCMTQEPPTGCPGARSVVHLSNFLGGLACRTGITLGVDCNFSSCAPSTPICGGTGTFCVGIEIMH
jgi:hypothetical protein